MSACRTVADALNDALPQTQCTRCSFPDCRAYAQAMAAGDAAINQCPPGGQQGVGRLAALTGRPELALNARHGIEAPRRLAVIDEAWCIGCTLCLKACPVDAIVGGPKLMHTVIDAECSGCELCIPVCPVDCIALTPVTGELTGWDAWSPSQAQRARERYDWHRVRLLRDATEQDTRLAAGAPAGRNHGAAAPGGPSDAPRSKASVIEAALARARAQRPP